MKAPALLAILKRKPLLYRTTRQVGSHRWLQSSEGHPPLLFYWHDGVELPGWVVKKVLVTKVGLTEKEALSLL